MRRLIALLFVGVIAITGQGCCSKGASTGWSFQVGRPPSIDTATVLGPSLTTYGGMGLASSATAGSVGLYSADARPLAIQTVERAPCVEQAPLPRRAAAPSTDCQTLQDVCTRIDRGFDRLAVQLEALPRAMGQKPLPMRDAKED